MTCYCRDSSAASCISFWFQQGFLNLKNSVSQLECVRCFDARDRQKGDVGHRPANRAVGIATTSVMRVRSPLRALYRLGLRGNQKENHPFRVPIVANTHGIHLKSGLSCITEVGHSSLFPTTLF